MLSATSLQQHFIPPSYLIRNIPRHCDLQHPNNTHFQWRHQVEAKSTHGAARLGAQIFANSSCNLDNGNGVEEFQHCVHPPAKLQELCFSIELPGSH